MKNLFPQQSAQFRYNCDILLWVRLNSTSVYFASLLYIPLCGRTLVIISWLEEQIAFSRLYVWSIAVEKLPSLIKKCLRIERQRPTDLQSNLYK